MPTLRKQVKRYAKRAKKSPSVMASYRALHLNLGVLDVDRPHLIDPESWLQVEVKTKHLPPATGPCVWGFDLGSTAAMSALAAFHPRTGRLQVMAAFPNEPSLADRGLQDSVGDLYQRMVAEGHLVQLGARTIPIAALLDEAVARFGMPTVIVADRFREAELRDALDRAKFPRCRLVFRGNGFRDGGEDVRAFRRAVAEKKVIPEFSLLLRASMRECIVKSDPSANFKIAKGSEAGRRKQSRDDTASATVIAVAEGTRLKLRKRTRLRLVKVA